MNETPFSELADLCETLEKMKKRKEIARLVGGFLKALPLDEVPQAVNLILGKAFSKRPSDVGGASFMKICPILSEAASGNIARSFQMPLISGKRFVFCLRRAASDYIFGRGDDP